MAEKYSNMDTTSAFGFLANAMGGGGDAGQSFPQSDAEDFSRGARFIPGEVTMDRRAGKRVEFVADGPPETWYWLRENGERISH